MSGAGASARPTVRHLARSLGMAASLGVAVALLAGCTSGPSAVSRTGSADVAEPETASPSSPPVTFAVGSPVVEAAGPGPFTFAESVDAAWVNETAGLTGIPERALRAYAASAVASNRENPGCGASWNLLAGIGRVESFHGLIHGSAIDDTGAAVPPIYGIPLDGDGVTEVPDSDGGVIDADPTIDRAVGPMQLIPGSWRNWRVDANADGIEDPQNIDDASFAAVHYLCRAGGDLTTAEGWSAGVLAWNRSDEYLQNVSKWAAFYGDAAGAG